MSNSAACPDHPQEGIPQFAWRRVPARNLKPQAKLGPVKWGLRQVCPGPSKLRDTPWSAGPLRTGKSAPSRLQPIGSTVGFKFEFKLLRYPKLPQAQAATLAGSSNGQVRGSVTGRCSAPAAACGSALSVVTWPAARARASQVRSAPHRDFRGCLLAFASAWASCRSKRAACARPTGHW